MKQYLILVIPLRSKVVGVILVSLRLSVCLSIRPSHIPCLLCKSHNSGWILFILSMHNDLWPWPISSRLFSLDFAIKLVKYGTTSVRSTACTVLVRFFLFPFNAQMITSMKGCVACNDLWPWLIYSRSFSHYFAMKLLRYGTSCCIHFTSCTVLDEFFPYLAQMITGMRGSVACNDLLPGHISSRSFRHDFAIKLLKYGTSCRVRSTPCAFLDVSCFLCVHTLICVYISVCVHIDGLGWNRSSSSANTLELPRSCIWPWMFSVYDLVCGCVCVVFIVFASFIYFAVWQ